MRIVLDTNTVLSALLFRRGRLAWLRTLWASTRIVPLCSQATLDEILRVLACPKFELDENEIRGLLGAYLFYVEVVDVPAGGIEGLPRCRDRDDEMFLDLAARGGAEVLVTGDQDLLALAEDVAFAIETPAEFKTRFGDTFHI